MESHIILEKMLKLGNQWDTLIVETPINLPTEETQYKQVMLRGM